MVQTAPAASVFGAMGHVLVLTKPVEATLALTVSGVACWFFSVTAFVPLVLPIAVFANERLVGDTKTGIMPVPVIKTIWGLCVAESVIVRVALSPR